MGGWIWGIARRQAALFLRRRGPAELALPELTLPGAVASDSRRAADARDAGDAGDAADAALSRLELADAVAALGSLDNPDRRVWQLMYVEDRPVAEVAGLMGIPEGTVKSRAHRVRRRLRAALARGGAAEGGTR